VKPAKITCSKFCGLRLHRLHNFRMAMAVRIHPPRRNRIDDFPPIFRVQIRALRPLDLDFGPLSACCVKGCQTLPSSFEILEFEILREGGHQRALVDLWQERHAAQNFFTR
jgi:hypothetical protein